MTGGRGRLIALEGIDGAGKSTLARALSRAIRRRGLSVRLHREPADATLGSLAQRVSPKDPWTGAVYFTVDRFLARPALERALARHDVVLTDRSFYSTLAYQGSALSPRERRRLADLQRSATREPDRVVLLDLPPREAVARLGGRPGARGPLERLRVLERVGRTYRTLAREGRWLVLDARRPVSELVGEVIERLPELAADGRAGRRRQRR